MDKKSASGTLFAEADLSLWRPGTSLDIPALAIIFGSVIHFCGPFLASWPRFTALLASIQLFGAFFVWKSLRKEVGRSNHEPMPSPTSSKPALQRHMSLFQRIQQQSAAVNPFVNPTWRFSELERLRIAAMSVTLVPIRLTFVILLVLSASFVSFLITLGISRQNIQSVPLSKLRQLCVRWIVSPLVRLVLFALGFVYVPRRGRPASSAEAPIVISNHISFVEPLLYVSIFSASPVGDTANLGAPVIGPIIRAFQLIGVDRKDPNSRAAVVHTIQDRAQSQKWQQTLLFPEGTTTVGNALIQFKPGAFLPGVPVQPCLVRYHNARFHPSWVSGGSKAPILLLRLLCEPINFMSCEFLPPYTPSAAEKSDAILFARNVRSLMAARLGVPVTEHSFEDIVLQQEALAAHQSPEFMQIELEKIKSALHCDVATIKKQLLKFKAMDKNGDGMLDVLEFERGLGFTEPSDVLRNLFSQLDVYETGRIDFREFLLGLGVLSSSSPQDTDAVVELAFKMFDLEGTGRVRVDVLHRAFRRMIPDASSDEEHQAFAELEAKDTGSGVDLSAFKEFVLRDSRYLALFKQTIASVSEDSTTKVSKSK